MKTATELKSVHDRIVLLKGQNKLLQEEWLELQNKENKSKDETKHQSKISSLSSKLINEIAGLQKKFKDLSEQLINEIVNS